MSPHLALNAVNFYKETFTKYKNKRHIFLFSPAAGRLKNLTNQFKKDSAQSAVFEFIWRYKFSKKERRRTRRSCANNVVAKFCNYAANTSATP